jgi:hypothetical protein
MRGQISRPSIVLVFLIGVLSACALWKAQREMGARREEVVVVESGIRLLHHAYIPITRLDGEHQGYGMYTYVLFGNRVGEDAPTLAREVVQRYVSLLEAIESSISSAAALEEAKVPEQRINVFCIPSKLAYRRPTLDNYNSDLALTYRSVAMGGFISNEKFLRRLSTAPGPFLISTLHPLNQIRRPEPMLLADLSAHNPKAMREVVAMYKERLDFFVPEYVELFEPLRLELLTLILDADENVTLVREAVSAWLPKQ